MTTATQSPNPERAEYTLFLDRSRTARAFDPEESLWTPELTRIFELLGGQLDALESGGDGRTPPLLSIAVFGTHGSGKTSLLHTLRDRIQRPHVLAEQQADSAEKKRLRDAFHPVKDRVASLPVLKPNLLVAGQESFLYSVLAAAVEAEQDQRREQERNALDGPRGDERSRASAATPAYASDRFLTPVQQAFQEVSEYLQVIDQTESGSREHDPLGVSLERLERHTSDLRLREQMRSLLDVLASQLTGIGRQSLILMPVDDADMSKGSITRTLDTYRRYLLHPRLVPVFTFTGRLSEELLTAHFSDRLAGEQGRSREIADRRNFEEQIAFQYLARLFPVRNRIRLGATTVRVQEAHYQVQRSVRSTGTTSAELRNAATGDGTQDAGAQRRRVLDLLERGSVLLFGHPRWLVEPRVDLPLRPSRLRRQLQILDALHAVGVTDLVADEAANGSGGGYGGAATDPGQDPRAAMEQLRASSSRWAEMFEEATWAILDVHRDALKEVDLYLDELYGWPSRSLREWLLVRMLELDPDQRRILLKRWRYRTENRRGQIVSLLIANAFRPALHHREEIPGQEPLTGLRRGSGDGRTETENHLTPAKGLLWFLNLWLGFYLPLIVARNRGLKRAKGRDGDHFEPIQGIGWHLDGGPAQAVQEALSNGEIYSTGMMFVDGRMIDEFLDPSDEAGDGETSARTALMILIWCFYGHEGNEPWGAVSLWRGLSLIGKLLQAQERFRRELGDGEENERKRKIRALLKSHFETAWIPTSLRPSRGEKPDQGGVQKFENPLEDWGDAGGTEGTRRTIERLADDLVDDLFDWMQDADDPDVAIDPLASERTAKTYEAFIEHGEADGDEPLPETGTPEDGADEPQATDDGEKEAKKIRASYDTCFLRRLHGDDLMGSLWPQLEKVYFEIESRNEAASNVITKWTEVLMEYWQYRPLLDILGNCPFLRPFCVSTSKVPPRYTSGGGKFLGESFKSGGFFEIKAADELPAGNNGGETPNGTEAAPEESEDAEESEETTDDPETPGAGDEGVLE